MSRLRPADRTPRRANPLATASASARAGGEPGRPGPAGMSPRESPESSAEQPAESAPRTPAEIVAGVAQGRVVVQDFCPMTRSIEWTLGQLYWSSRGGGAFVRDEVPYLIHNDGAASANAAAVVFAALEEMERGGRLGPRVNVLEIGVGSALFARFFLDALRDLSRAHGTDYYDRVCYVAADVSPRMLEDVAARGVLDGHPGRYLLHQLDAADPVAIAGLAPLVSAGTPGRNGNGGGGPFHAIILNYVLDVLPATVLEFAAESRRTDGNGPETAATAAAAAVRELHVRTCLARDVNLREYTTLSAEEIVAKAASADPADLIDLYPLFALEYEFRPVDPAGVPFATSAAALARGEALPAGDGDGNGDGGTDPAAAAAEPRPHDGGRCVLHNYGAVGCLEQCLRLAGPQGVILLSDYPYQPEAAAAAKPGAEAAGCPDEPVVPTHQRFGGSTAIGLNFALLRRHFAGRDDCRWVEPDTDDGHTCVRLLGRRPAAATVRRFHERFGRGPFDRANRPLELARTQSRHGMFEAALVSYGRALQCQPRNWALISEVATFLLQAPRDYRAAAEVARAGLALNPLYPDLWNTLGDALFYLQEIELAHDAFTEAVRLSPVDVRARYNRVYTYVARNDLPAALHEVAEALALDKSGAYRTRLLEKQSEILARLKARADAVASLMANRVTPPA